MYKMKKLLCSLLAMSLALTTFAAGENENKEKKTKLSLSLPKISGYIQAGYQGDYNKGAIEDNNSSTFAIKRLRVVAKGSLSDRISYVGQLEGFSTSKDAQNKALISILDLFVNIKLTNWLNLSVGQFPIPITIDTHDIAPGYLETPDISLIGAKLACRNSVTGETSYGRDTGIKLFGDIKVGDNSKMISYILAATNGSQTNTVDNNNKKDLTGRLLIRPIDNLMVTAAGRLGNYSDELGNNIALNTLSAGVVYDNTKILFRSEYVKSFSEEQTPTYLANINEDGFYATLGYRFGDIMPLVRYDAVNIHENSVIGGAYSDEQLHAGVLWSPAKFLRVQAYYIMGNISSNANSLPSLTTGKYQRAQIILCCYF